MRKAFEKLEQLYGSRQGQDILETVGSTALITGTQALSGEMTPEELALSAALGLGGGFAGRKYGGQLGTAIGRQLDKQFPETMLNAKGLGEQAYTWLGNIRPGARMKFDASMEGRNPGEGLGNLIGRTYGDNVLQALIGLGTYSLFNED